MKLPVALANSEFARTPGSHHGHVLGLLRGRGREKTSSSISQAVTPEAGSLDEREHGSSLGEQPPLDWNKSYGDSNTNMGTQDKKRESHSPPWLLPWKVVIFLITSSRISSPGYISMRPVSP